MSDVLCESIKMNTLIGGLQTLGLKKKCYPDKPLVTIITVVINSEFLLERTILSVLSQDYENIEYIIVDGGSTDTTLDVVRNYESRIDYWISEPDQGISHAMNKGITFANGKLIHHLHAGDEFACENVVSRVVLSYNREKWKWCFGNQILTNVSGDETYRFCPPEFKNWKLYLLNTIPHATVFSESSLFVSAGYFSMSYQCAMDYHLWLRFSTISKPKQFDFEIARFLIGGRSSNIQLALGEERKARQEILDRSLFFVIVDIFIFLIRLIKYYLNIKSFARKIESEKI